MQISLRSHLAAGSAALIGASAIALTPVIAQPVALPALPATTAADVALAALDFSTIIGGVGQALGGTVDLATADVGAIVQTVLGYQDDIALFASTVVSGLTQAATSAIGGETSPIPAIVQAVVGLIPDLIANGPAAAFANLQTGITAAFGPAVAVLTGAVNGVVGAVMAAADAQDGFVGACVKFAGHFGIGQLGLQGGGAGLGIGHGV
jgi:hypothetical protein